MRGLTRLMDVRCNNFISKEGKAGCGGGQWSCWKVCVCFHSRGQWWNSHGSPWLDDQGQWIPKSFDSWRDRKRALIALIIKPIGEKYYRTIASSVHLINLCLVFWYMHKIGLGAQLPAHGKSMSHSVGEFQQYKRQLVQFICTQSVVVAWQGYDKSHNTIFGNRRLRKNKNKMRNQTGWANWRSDTNT